VDEAHNFLNKIYDKKYDIDYEYKLGLSATPVFGTDSSKTDVLVNFFGGIVYDLPIEKAIGKFLVNYNYYPIFVNATEEDEEKFNLQRKIMMGCWDKNGKLIDPDKYAKAHRAKLRAIAMAEEKLERIDEFIDIVDEKDHFIIYCSDGRLKDDKKHLLEVVDELNSKGFKPSQFTCEENMKQRESLIDNFNKGFISSLVAIRCLDEGINIPSIKSALILSSNDNYREFVQRRGRILRKYEGKEKANIIDVIVLPSIANKAIAEIEFRRYYEYAKLALNKDSLMNDLEKYLNTYDLTPEDISFKNEYVEDVEIE
jgi:superfamily II DNA or RNA helicase